MPSITTITLGRDAFDALLAAGLDLYYLNLSVSLWGQRVTGLPIDFQVQDADSANADHDGRRDPCGMGPKVHQESRYVHGIIPTPGVPA